MIRPFLILFLTGFLCAAAATDVWESAIRAFEARAASVPANSIVFYGSSTFTKWTTLADDFPGLPVVNCGFGGSGTADLLRYAPRVVVPLKPKWVVLYCGGNDIGIKTPAVIAAATGELIAAIHVGCPKTRIVLMSLKPTMKRIDQSALVQEVNRRYQELAQADPLVAYLDLWTPFLAADGTPDLQYLAADLLHPSREGYRRIASLLRPIISPSAPPGTTPEIAVTRGGAIADGGSDTVTGTVAGSGTTLTYTIANRGDVALSIGATGAITGTNCSVVVTTAAASSVAAGASTTLRLTVTPTAAGTWSFPVSFATNDANENPTNWTVSGTATMSGTSGGTSGGTPNADGGGRCGFGGALVLVLGMMLALHQRWRLVTLDG